jgi:hypothetical protein
VPRLHAPQGINAVYLISRIVREIEALNERLPADPFLGKGTVTVSHIECKSPSLCAVPGEAYIHLDRRLTAGETKTQALREVRDAARRAGVRAEVFVPRYEQAAWTGRVYPTEKYYRPGWRRKTRRRCAPPSRRTAGCLATPQAGPLGVQHQRRRHRGHVRHPVRRLRPGGGIRGAHG